MAEGALSSVTDRAERIREIVDLLLAPWGQNALSGRPVLDVSRPNIHDSKAAFQLELDTVERTLTCLDTVLNTLLAPCHETDSEQLAMLRRLANALDRGAIQRLSGLEVNSSSDLIRKNIVDSGIFFNSMRTLLDFYAEFDVRRRELLDEGKQFWTVSHRPPNYYARTIALRLARLYAMEAGKRPTFGTSRDGGHPSTEFGRALEQVFAVLGVRANVKGAAKWAIEQLTDDDLKGPKLGTLLGLATSTSPTPNLAKWAALWENAGGLSKAQ